MLNHALVALATLTAMGCASHAPGPAETRSKAPEPVVDAACLERARAGTLLTDLPATVGTFGVTATATGARLHRTGTALDEAAGAKLWTGFGSEVFAAGGFGTSSHGAGSTYRCEDTAPASCIHADLYVCQTSLATVATRIETMLARQGLAAAALTLELTFAERNGPPCRENCTPKPHYSVEKSRYDAGGDRHSLDEGRGMCTGDGDCVGSNHCNAWYLAGGTETAIFIQRREPTFCGCVEQRCTWFTQ